MYWRRSWIHPNDPSHKKVTDCHENRVCKCWEFICVVGKVCQLILLVSGVQGWKGLAACCVCVRSRARRCQRHQRKWICLSLAPDALSSSTPTHVCVWVNTAGVLSLPALIHNHFTRPSVIFLAVQPTSSRRPAVHKTHTGTCAVRSADGGLWAGKCEGSLISQAH